MSDFNIRKFLNEHEAKIKIPYDEFTKDQVADKAAWDSQPQSNECIYCDKGKDAQGDDCAVCGGRGELFDDTDRPSGLTKAQEIAQDMADSGFAAISIDHFKEMFNQYAQKSFGGGRYFQGSEEELAQLEQDTVKAYKAILKQKSISGSDFNAVGESDGVAIGIDRGEFGPSGLTQAQAMAQDMIDSGMAATSLDNFNELFYDYLYKQNKDLDIPRFSDGFQVLRADTLTAYRRLLRQYHDGVAESGGDRYDDMEWGDADDGPEDWEPAVNMCPNCEGAGCDECGGAGEVFETQVDEEEINEIGDMFAIDLAKLKEEAGITEDPDTRSKSEKKASAYKAGQKDSRDNKGADMSHVKTTWGPNGDDYKAGYANAAKEFNEAEDNRSKDERKASAYKAGWNDSKDSGGEDRSDLKTTWGPTGDDYQRGYKAYQDSMSTKETAPQGKAPGAQLKGKETIKNKGIKGYDDAHPASGRLVGEDAEQLEKMRENAGLGHKQFTPYTDYQDVSPYDDDQQEYDDMKWGSGLPSGYPGNNDLEEENKEEIFRRVMGWDAEVDLGPTDARDQLAKDRAPVDYDLEGGDALADEFLHEYGEFDDDYDSDDAEDYDNDPDDEEYEGDESVTIKGKLPHESYWNHRGKHQDKIEPLEALLPSANEVEDYENNPALENFRRGANVYYDIYNNGAWDTGNGQRGAEFEELFDLGPGQTIDAEDLEELIDDTVLAAWNEQTTKGTVSEEVLHEEGDEYVPDIEYKTLLRKYHGGDKSALKRMHALRRKDLDKKFPFPQFEAEGDDMGEEVVVSPGDMVQVDSSLGGQAKVIAQRPGYIVVNLPKGGMKLLRDDEWWLDDEAGAGEEEYADVEGGYEEPEELTFEGINEDQASVMGAHSQDDRQNVFFSQMGEGYTVLPPMDPKYVERDGLEGPFRARNGKVYYYDPKEGKNYDPDTDFYMSDEEWFAHDRDPNMEYVKYKAPAAPEPKPLERGRMDEESTEFGANYRSNMKYTDSNAPSPGDYVMTKHGKGVVIDSWQNNDGYYVFFDVELVDGDNDGVKKSFHITAVKKFKEGMSEVWMPQSNDRTGTNRLDKHTLMKQKQDREVGHERAWNNFQIFIDGKPWKVVANSNHASAIVKTLQRKGKTASYGETMAAVSEGLEEGKWDYDRSMKNKGSAESEPNRGKQHGSKNRKARKAFRKAEKQRKHQAMMKGEKWAQEEVPEAIVPYDKAPGYNWLDDESGEITKDHPDVIATRDRAKAAAASAADDTYSYDDWDMGDPEPKKVGWDAIGDFGDVAGGGGDPIDYIMQKYGFSMEDIDAAAVEQGYENAGEWADSYTGEKNFSESGGTHFEKMSAPALRRWLDKHWSDEPGMAPVLGTQLKRAKKVLRQKEQGIKESNIELSDENWNTAASYWADWTPGNGKKGVQHNPDDMINEGFVSTASAMADEFMGDTGITGGDDMKEGSSEFKKGSKKKGGGYNKPGSVAQKKASSKQSRQDDKKAVTAEGIADMGMGVQSIPKTKDNALKTDGKIVIKDMNSGKTYAFSDERDAVQHFGMNSWKRIKDSPKRFNITWPVTEIETATDELDADRQLGEPTLAEPTAMDSDAELAGMQLMIKNLLQEPDQDMEDAIQTIANPEDQGMEMDQQLGDDEILQLKQMLGLFK